MKLDLAREAALKILYEINEKGAYSNIALNKYFSGHELTERDRAFVNRAGLRCGEVETHTGQDDFSMLKHKTGETVTMDKEYIAPWRLPIAVSDQSTAIGGGQRECQTCPQVWT